MKYNKLYLHRWISQNLCAFTIQTSPVIRNGSTATVTSAFSPHQKKKALASQKITIDHPQQGLGVDKILNSGCGHTVKSFVEWSQLKVLIATNLLCL